MDLSGSPSPSPKRARRESSADQRRSPAASPACGKREEEEEASSPPVSASAAEVMGWGVDEVAEFVASVDMCKEYAEVSHMLIFPQKEKYTVYS